ncbi:MAG: hypothetical protein UV05_C0014G0012 [candidate division CPR1 bacterium GW2011_GWA2_42_17]|uniref:HEPN domain-containing protein n=1 Tax=candidate division CPR1 bacterium GW2011_GWA2_42_17 TaxID=1618341 RepID=A0A0G0Z5N3_9BACT|nr:MAG: hypothetical protein UV05_C0014G0012 [candidate division CPR1 bacterium GW2011_GWA2_42_17]
MTKDEAVKYWKEGAADDLETAEELFNKNKRFNHAFFFYHLALEKLLKGLHQAKKGSPAPFTHKLSSLARMTEIPLDKTQEKQLDEITTYNVSARYEDYKRQFYKKTKDQKYASKWRGVCLDLYNKFLKMF